MGDERSHGVIQEAIKTVTELGASPKRVCVCTDDRDADDLFVFGLNWVVTEAIKAGVDLPAAWSMGSLHPATRYFLDGEFGALGHGRRADVVILDDNLKVVNTWYGGELAVENGKVTPVLDEQLSNHRYQYPKKAYQTVNMPENPSLVPEAPVYPAEVTILRTEPPGIVTLHRQVTLDNPLGGWGPFLEENQCCHLAVIERYGVEGNIAHGFLQNFGLTEGAVVSSVGHDAHNVIVQDALKLFEKPETRIRWLYCREPRFCIGRIFELDPVQPQLPEPQAFGAFHFL